MMSNYYRFGRLLFQVEGLLPEVGAEDFLPRFSAAPGRADVVLSVSRQACLTLPAMAQERFRSYGLQVFSDGGCCYAQYGGFQMPYAMLSYAFSRPMERSLQIAAQTVHFSQEVLLSCVMLEDIFLRNGCALLHASFILYEGQAILFTAPCGTGKSTQAALWHKYRGAEIINGDKTLLFSEGNRLIASGLPLAGTSGICENLSAPVRAIVVLSQAAENRIAHLRGANAVKALLAQIYLQRWLPESVSLAADAAERIAGAVPVYSFACVPDESAVCALENTLKGEC